MCATPRSCESFLSRIDRFLEFFMGEVGGIPATPFEIKERALRLVAGTNASRTTPLPHPAPELSGR